MNFTELHALTLASPSCVLLATIISHYTNTVVHPTHMLFSTCTLDTAQTCLSHV